MVSLSNPLNLRVPPTLNRTAPRSPGPSSFILHPSSLLVAALLCAASFLLDDPVIAWVRAHPSRTAGELARFFTRWGDFPPIVLLLLLLLLIAWRFKRPFFTHILLLMLGSAVAGGLAANILRLLTGRARPSAGVPAGWYGLRAHGAWIVGSYRYSSFPSAHTAVAIACIVPLWLLLPPRQWLFIACPATVFALCVAASRVLLNAHHFSDVFTSIWLGIVVATLVCARFASGNAAIQRNP